MPAAPGSVCLGYIHNGQVRAEFMLATIQLISDPAYDLLGEITAGYAGALIADARNAMAAQFLDGPLDWLWMVDSDVVFTPGTLTRLTSAADPEQRPIITGMCPVARGTGATCAVYHARTGEGGDEQFTPLWSWPDEQVIEVDACGAACLLIHRSSLEAVRKDEGGRPCWFDQIRGHRTVYGEDLSFCLRATAARLPIHAHTGAQVAHLKTAMLGQARP